MQKLDPATALQIMKILGLDRGVNQQSTLLDQARARDAQSAGPREQVTAASMMGSTKSASGGPAGPQDEDVAGDSGGDTSEAIDIMESANPSDPSLKEETEGGEGMGAGGILALLSQGLGLGQQVGGLFGSRAPQATTMRNRQQPQPHEATALKLMQQGRAGQLDNPYVRAYFDQLYGRQ